MISVSHFFRKLLKSTLNGTIASFSHPVSSFYFIFSITSIPSKSKAILYETIFHIFRDTIMALASNITDKKRKGFGGPVSVDLQRHNGSETAHRDGRCEGR